MLKSDILQKKSDEIVNSIVDGDFSVPKEFAMGSAIIGVGAFHLATEKDDGHHYNLIVDSVNKNYRNYPQKRADIIFENGLLDVARRSRSLKSFSDVVHTLSYQLDLQKNKAASFNLNVDRIIPELYERILEFEKDGARDCLEFVDKADNYLSTEHNVHLK